MAKKKAKKTGMKLIPAILLVVVAVCAFGFTALQVTDYTDKYYSDASSVSSSVLANAKEDATKWEGYNLSNYIAKLQENASVNADAIALYTQVKTMIILMLVCAGLLLASFVADLVLSLLGKGSKKISLILYIVDMVLAVGVIVFAGVALGAIVPITEPSVTTILGSTITTPSIYKVGLAFPMIIGFGSALVIASGVLKVVKK